jgi:hypothetical protein
MIGIYKIESISNKKKYIGKSKQLEKRWYFHKYYLNISEHHCRYLQHSWNKLGDLIEEGLITKIKRSDN